MKILIVSDSSIYAVAHSFTAALKRMGHEVESFDPYKAIAKYVRLNKAGKILHTFVPVEAWTRKGNRELAVFFQKYRPDKVMVFGNAPVLFGTLAFMKSISESQIILFWPDTLMNLGQDQLNNSRLYDLLATYSSNSIEVFKKLGYRNVKWLPFAGDSDFLGGANKSTEFLYDISFAGGWRPEREKTITAILDAFPSIKFSVAGTEWGKNCKDKRILKNFRHKPLYGKAFGDFLRQSRISLNVIDNTNYPAANMRFFEIPAAGGLQLCSACPEQAGIFKDRETILYFNNDKEAIEQVKFVFANEQAAAAIRAKSYELIQQAHTYESRLKEIFS